ncbi:MAG TPA: zf-TFIIB domain-containing protein [Thermoanaerobaculia bacterium]|nr:zf-TFIIB domain-containing protein [Thermoanaerobaculia bacterium]
MLHLVACTCCGRQFDVGERPAGSRFQCSCGGEVEVAAPAPHDAAVVHCSACGAPREGDEEACRYCGSSFTLHERDLDTICPGCMARVSGSARFCHHCGCPILVGQATAGATSLHCPACPGESLRSRRLGESLAAAECPRCGGLWLDNTVFEIVAARARQGHLAELAAALPAPGSEAVGAPVPRAPVPRVPQGPAASPAQPARAGGAYRPCAVCGALMNRRNYGRSSGVILDVCQKHGIWFGLDGLPRLLAWIHDGGEERARQRAVEEAHAAESYGKSQAALSHLGGSGVWVDPEADAEADLFTNLSSLLGDGLRHLFRPR